MHRIVIVGGGFAGLTCALELAKNGLARQTILLDRQSKHVLHAHLYELAAAPEELSGMRQLNDSATVALPGLLARRGVGFRQAEVKEVLLHEKKLITSVGEVGYEYLVLAQGSAANFFNIPGAEQYGLPLKTVAGALRIRNDIEFAVQSARMKGDKGTVRIVVVGGGFAGVELAAELPGLLDFVCWKNGFPRERVEVLLIEGTGRLLPGLSPRAGGDAAARLKELGVSITFGALVSRVDQAFIELTGGEKIAYDCLVWTAGIRADNAKFTPALTSGPTGRLPTNEYLQLKSFPEVFVIGDQTGFLDNSGYPAPATATNAIDQGRYAAHAIPLVARNRLPGRPYRPKERGFIVPLGGNWAILKSSKWYLAGRLPYFIRTAVWGIYLARMLGLRTALSKVLDQVKLYSRN